MEKLCFLRAVTLPEGTEPMGKQELPYFGQNESSQAPRATFPRCWSQGSRERGRGAAAGAVCWAGSPCGQREAEDRSGGYWHEVGGHSGPAKGRWTAGVRGTQGQTSLGSLWLAELTLREGQGAVPPLVRMGRAGGHSGRPICAGLGVGLGRDTGAPTCLRFF